MIKNNIDAECLNLTDISTDIFRIILKFIYTDELPQSDTINFVHFFAAAGRLKIKKLKKFAANKLIDNLTEKNAIEMLFLANKYDDETLRQNSFNEIKKILSDVKISDDLAMEPEKLKKLLAVKKEKDEMMKMMEEKFSNILNN